MAQNQIFRGVETTTYCDHDGALVGVYRGTPVAKQFNNVITLDTGGWKSRTTKLRMNQFARTYCSGAFGVSQKDYSWFVHLNGESIPFDGETITFTI